MEKMPVKRQNTAAKKKLLIACAVILGLLLILTCASFIIDYIEGNKSVTSNDGDREVDYNFYPADFEEDIFQNQDYSELFNEGFIDFKEGSVTLGITKDDAYKYGADTKLIFDMLDSIIYGDNDRYNQYFSSGYYQNHSEKSEFTMQMLYDIKIERISSEKVETENGDYTKAIFTVEYKIYKNNGTFRRDIGEGSKKQYITLTNQAEQWLIDNISTVN